MGLFSRNKDAADALPADDVPFEALRRSTRNTRKPRATQSASGSTDFDGGAPLDPAQASKTRARRRLIGAVALALAAIVFVPMLFDRTPVSPSDDIGLQIPDRDAPFEGRRGVPDPARTPLRPSSDLPVKPSAAAPAAEAPAVPDTAAAAPELMPEKPVVAAAPPAAVEKPVEKPAPKPADKPAEKPADKPAEKSAEKPKAVPPPVATAKPADDPRAVAALEGKDESAAPAAGDTRQYAVQIAAFTSPDRAKGLRDQLTGNGLKSYVESVSTAQGVRTRVRLGPFASRDAADRAKQKLKTMKLDGSVVPL